MSIKKFIWVICLAVILTGAWDASADVGQAAPDSLAAAVGETQAQSTQQAEIQVPSVTDDILPSLSRIGISLLVIIVIIYGTVFLLKKLSGNKVSGGGRGRAIQVIEQTYVGPKKSVCLLRMADRAVLIGITDSQINMLTECEWEALPADSRESIQKSQAGFSSLLSDAATKLFKTKGGTHGTTA